MVLAPRKRLCAVCDSTNLTARLCDPCRADPVNAGWAEDEASASADEVAAHGTVAHGLGALIDRPCRSPTQKQQRIVALIILGGEPEPYAYRDRRGRRRGTRRRFRPFGVRDIARRARCSPSYVVKVRRQFYLD